MNKNHKELISMGLTLAIIALTLFIIHRFLPSLIWAAIIGVATYPLYRRWCRLFGEQKNIAAFLFTFLLSLILIIPLSWLVSVLVKELQLLINYLQLLHHKFEGS